MEPVVIGWMEKLGEKGTGWILAGILAVLIWALIKHIRDLYKSGAADGRLVEAALSRSTKAAEENTTVGREMSMTNRELVLVVKELDKRIELVSQQAKDRGDWEADKAAERAASIERTIRDVLTGRV
jgi:hypothetical protein